MSELTLEQQLAQRNFELTADKMSREQAIEVLKDVHKTLMLRENVYKELLKHQWGLEQLKV